MHLQIENTNRCNARCVFCPHPTMQRPKGTQALALTQKILDDAVTVPIIDHLTFTGLGEPLLDGLLEERIAYAKQLMPAIPIEVFTNGHALTLDRLDRLIQAGMTGIYVSLNAVRASQREQSMGLHDFDRLVGTLRDARTAFAHRCSIVVKAIAAKDLMEVEDGEGFREMWGGWASEGGAAFLHLEGNWAGKTFPMRVIPTQSCARALGQIMVLWDGRVSLCCFDGEGDEILGDLTTQTIREVYNGGRALEIRTAHAEGRRAEIPICARCTSI
jgi:uncharacterized Fe-S cluster-containing radical SAM superfamily enzyme